MASLSELLAAREKQVPRGVSSTHPIFVREARGAIVTDVEGKEYLDFTGGIGVNNLGHGHEAVRRAAREQLERYIHPCFHVAMYEPYVALAGRLNGIVPGRLPKKTMLVNSGAEAVENAVKIARHATGRSAILTFRDAFHGRTLLSLTLTSKTHPLKLGFGPFAPEVYRLPYAYCYRCPFDLAHPGCALRCARSLQEFFDTHVPAEQVAALIVEPVLGEGGFVVPPPEYLPALQRICQERGILFIADEIQTGFGRTARLLAVEHSGVEPDLVVMAKSLAGGFPLAAVTGKAEIMDHPPAGGLGGTFGGNPVACRAALAVLDEFESRGLLARAAEIGARTLERFRSLQGRHAVVGDVRGLGAMVGMELVADRRSKEPATALTARLIARCRERGLLLVSAGVHANVIRPLMPLTIGGEELERGLAILAGALGELAGGGA